MGMDAVRNWFRKHVYETHVIAFLLMVIPPVPLYLAAQQQATAWIWPLLGLVVLGNILALLVK